MRRIFSLGFVILLFVNLSACSAHPTALPFDEPTSAPSPTVAAPVAAATSEPASVAATAMPDGLLKDLIIVYEKSGSLWVSAAGSLAQLTQGDTDSRPRLSADAKWVVFQRGLELWGVEIGGQNAHKLFGEEGVAPDQIEFVAWSHKVIFTTSAAEGGPRFDLNLADVGNGVAQNLLPAGQGGKFTIAPDGDSLALVQPAKILIYKLSSGSAPKVLCEFPPVVTVQGHYLPPIAWMENGYGFKTIIPGAAGKPARFMFIMAAGGTPAQLAELHSAALTISNVFIAPDGSRVLYLKELDGSLEMHVIDAGTADRAYVKKERGKIGILGWAPDSKNMLFWQDEPGRVWTTTGETSSLLSDAAVTTNIAWLNASSFLFTGNSELRLMTSGQSSQVIDTGVAGGFDARLNP
jgi:dipeptidyl aminopeptidase/acylaminoacyl peptidase